MMHPRRLPPTPARPRTRGLCRAAALLLAATLAAPAAAQIGLPSVPNRLPELVPRLPERAPEPIRRTVPPPARPLAAAVTETTEPLSETALATLRSARATAAQALLQAAPQGLETDPDGAPVRRGELLLIDPSAAVLAAAQVAGFTPLRETVLQPLDIRHVVLAPPPGLTLQAALAQLRAFDPALQADYHHLYLKSGAAAAGTPAAAPAGAAPARVGLIDGAVDAAHPALRGLTLRRWGCGQRAVGVDAHGTAVASLLAGQGAVVGAAPGATVWAADIYCGAPDGGGAEALAEALAWLAREEVGVVNISLVGPPNRLIERVVAALLARGHALVAAVGNDGPAAPPLYPAAYPGVLGVTGVGPGRRVLPEALQGPQVMFAAAGADVVAAQAGSEGIGRVRGTSFAAPRVAGRLAALLPRPDVAARTRALQALQAEALDLGAPGRDPVYGHGLLGDAPAP